jgi:hypothetical protein
MRILLVLHAILLLLASTGFTIVTTFLGNSSFQWCYFKYSSRNGFGVQFVSDFSALEIATYLIAFAIGVLGFSIALKNGRPLAGGLGVLLSLIGFLSFAIEGSHWIVDHNRSWVAFSSALMFALVFLACLPKRLSNDANAAPKIV